VATGRAGIATGVLAVVLMAQGNEGSFGSALSADGRCVVFISFASNLVRGETNGFSDVFMRDRGAETRSSSR
jgi:hypothetical protein